MKQLDPNIEQELSSQCPVPMEQENNVTPGTDAGMSTQPEDSILTEVITQGQAVDQLDSSELEKMAPVSAENKEAIDYKAEVQLEIRPPVDIKQIIGIMRYLDSLPEVETTELIPVADRPSIIVSLNEPVHLIEILKTLPEVGQVEKVTNGEATSFTDTLQSKRRKIQITLSKDRISAEAKEVLTSEASNTQTRGPLSNLK